jgi:hypothetical protein
MLYCLLKSNLILNLDMQLEFSRIRKISSIRNKEWMDANFHFHIKAESMKN